MNRDFRGKLGAFIFQERRRLNNKIAKLLKNIKDDNAEG